MRGVAEPAKRAEEEHAAAYMQITRGGMSQPLSPGAARMVVPVRTNKSNGLHPTGLRRTFDWMRLISRSTSRIVSSWDLNNIMNLPMNSPRRIVLLRGSMFQSQSCYRNGLSSLKKLLIFPSRLRSWKTKVSVLLSNVRNQVSQLTFSSVLPPYPEKSNLRTPRLLPCSVPGTVAGAALRSWAQGLMTS